MRTPFCNWNSSEDTCRDEAVMVYEEGLNVELKTFDKVFVKAHDKVEIKL